MLIHYQAQLLRISRVIDGTRFSECFVPQYWSKWICVWIFIPTDSLAYMRKSVQFLLIQIWLLIFWHSFLVLSIKRKWRLTFYLAPSQISVYCAYEIQCVYMLYRDPVLWPAMKATSIERGGRRLQTSGGRFILGAEGAKLWRHWENPGGLRSTECLQHSLFDSVRVFGDQQ